MMPHTPVHCQRERSSLTPQGRRRCGLWLLLTGNFLIPSILCTPDQSYPYYIPSIHSISASTSRSIFGIRGGRLFGFGNRAQGSKNGGSGDDDDGGPKRFPAMSQDEIEDKLNIPIFGITDTNGNGVILSDSGNHVFHFFFSKHMANAALKAVASSNIGAPELKVSVFHLGKCWFKLINCSQSKTFKLHKFGNEGGGETTLPVCFRLVPNMKDLMGARILTGLDPNDVKQLKDAVETPNAQKILSIIQKASADSTAFNKPFDQIPVFTIAQMRVRKKNEDGIPSGQVMIPMHLSTKTMNDAWREFIKHSPQFEEVEATLQLVELHSLINLMQADSDFDFRNLVFIIPSYDQDDINMDQNNNDDDSDDDSGGGGDNGMMNPHFDEILIEPYVSMEVYEDTNDKTLVQL